MRRLSSLVLVLLLAAAPSPTTQTDRWVTPPPKPQPLLAHKTFHSNAMDKEVGYNIYFPPDYENKIAQRYPVLYWLHGMNQSESTDQYPIHYLDDAIKADAIKPMIVVYASGGQRTYYTDNPALRVLPETSIIKELIPHIDATYRTIPDRDHRAIAGMSMGGFGALKFAFKHPDLFSSVTAFAPGLRDPESFAKDRADILQRIFNNDPAQYDLNHPATLLKQNREQLKKFPISLYVGRSDPLLPGSQSLHRLLTEMKIDHTYKEFDAIEHNLIKLSKETQSEPFRFAAEHFK
jgi:enterochelin esterase-like enzyme